MILGGNWNAATARTGSATTPCSSTCRPATAATRWRSARRASRCTSRPKTKQPDLAAAYLDAITGPDAGQALVDTAQVPAATNGTAEPTDPFGKEVQEGWDQLVEDGGLTLFPDWSSPTMLQTMGQSFQEMLAGRIPPEDVISRTQDDWEKYHEELAGN